MNYRSFAENIVKKALRLGADEAEVYLEKRIGFRVTVRNGNIETVQQIAPKGLGLRVFKEKKLGFSYTSDFSERSLGEFLKKAVQLSLVSDPKPWNELPDFKKGKIQELDLYDPSVTEIPNEKKIKMAKEVERIALACDKRITKTEGYFNDWEIEIIIVNSKGISYSSKTTVFDLGVEVVAQEGDEMQMDWWEISKRYFKDLEPVEAVAKRASKRAVEKLGAKPVPTQKVPAVFDGLGAAYMFWWGVLWALNGDSVYKKTTFLTEALNNPVASKMITITDDPTIPRHNSSVPFDGEGNITRKNILVDKGVLKMFIYDTITARKAGVKVNTMAKRMNYQFLPDASFLNIIVENGNMNREKIISGIKNGFYVKDLRGAGTDDTTGNFSVGASGFWIKDGEIAFPVDGVTLGGKTLDILKNIELVADDLEVRAEVNSPSFKIAEITVGGKR